MLTVSFLAFRADKTFPPATRLSKVRSLIKQLSSKQGNTNINLKRQKYLQEMTTFSIRRKYSSKYIERRYLNKSESLVLKLVLVAIM